MHRLASHRPFAGVIDVMRWFQIQPDTSVGINTERPDFARQILASLSEWGVSRVSINWESLEHRPVLETLESWGYEVNIYNVPDMESFLKAALLLPRSLTADFSFSRGAEVVQGADDDDDARLYNGRLQHVFPGS